MRLHSAVRCLIALLALSVSPLIAQRQSGELMLVVTDSAGNPLRASVAIVSQANQVRVAVTTDEKGRYSARNLPFGPYRIDIQSPGFATSIETVDIRSEAPIEKRIRLGVAPVETTLTIHQSETLIDPHRTGTSHHIGTQMLETRQSSIPGRGVLEQVNSQPGWLLEANGVLHPRGSEYDTQYVIDGFPILDNRSPAFAPAFEPQELSAMRILTGGYPAEYGRKLGGIVELMTARDPRLGFHGKAVLQSGSFGTHAGYLSGQYVASRASVSLSALGARTDRFLDPPVERNFTNTSSSRGATGRVDFDISDRDRLRFYWHSKGNRFLVPNELVQQEAGQRQDRTSGETMGQASYHRVLSPAWIVDVRTMVRDVGASLWSNPLATPIFATQDRGFREGYVSASASAALGRHALKFGTESVWTNARERFSYRITGANFFEADDDEQIPPSFHFQERRRGNEQSAYLQDVIRAGAFTLSAGLRWDRYSLVVTENFVSPRLGAAWHLARAGLVLRASYDRAITIPAIENLLLASSVQAWRLTESTSGLVIRPARGNFYEAGFTKSLGQLRLDAAWFHRNIRNYADDDVFLNTGVSFPIAFDSASIHGYEVKVEIPRWRALSGYVSYSNLVGTGFLPVSGGLFLDDDADLLQARASFPISQDQRNTVRTRFRYELHPRLWTAVGMSYNSGLPVEREGEFEDDDAFEDDAALRRRYGDRVVDAVDLQRGRVRPWHTVDLSAGFNAWRTERGSVQLQADMLNVSNRLTLINFAGLFSGTAIGTPRTLHVRLQIEF